MFFPQLCHLRQVVALHFFDTGRAINEPGDGGGVAQVGGEFDVGVLEKIPLAGKAPYFGGERREVDQVFIPDLPVCGGEYLEYTHAAAATQFKVEPELGFLCGGPQQQGFHPR
ncbi:hypothetical protein JF535_15475 [Microbulbifer salipaludis]|uniref:Uncharacterized protein n=1 Tax=Microbulbifer salipaludis TaxID=187980 RepID=A0ABS3EAB9_9GAMM|nr:hypothetical protein [Microbulbifer salipaludis]MBN8432248.1 hypothetical protein [Microbulbifer salipaludis]